MLNICKRCKKRHDCPDVASGEYMIDLCAYYIQDDLECLSYKCKTCEYNEQCRFQKEGEAE